MIRCYFILKLKEGYIMYLKSFNLCIKSSSSHIWEGIMSYYVEKSYQNYLNIRRNQQLIILHKCINPN